MRSKAVKIEVLEDPESVARRAAGFIAEEARVCVSAHGRFVMAVSGGRTPWLMLSDLAEEDIPWNSLHVAQVDERVAPAGDPGRNFTHLRETLLARAPISPDRIHAMPVDSPDLERGAGEYAGALARLAGSPPVLDLVHLGLGPDGHTASLVPGDPVLEVDDRDVAVTAPYMGRRRMTLTFPALNRARRVLWLVTGADKAPMLARLLEGDPSIPAGRVRAEAALVLADRFAAGRQAVVP